jgi:hypothetical protein
MQTLSFQQNNRASSDSMTFQFHQDEAAVQHVDHRALFCRSRLGGGRRAHGCGLEIKEAAEEMELSGIDMAVNADVWNVKLFRWLDNKEDSAVYRENVKQLAPAIISVLPLEYRGRVVKNDNFALRIARSVKEDAEAIQAVVLKAPQHERLKEISESIVAKFYLDGPDSVAPLMAMVTTMLGAM